MKKIDSVPSEVVPEEKINKLVEQFKTNKFTIENFKNDVESIIKKFLFKNNINVHNISSRVKEEFSLTNKIKKKGNKYQSISDITDLAGIRIITYFEDDVDKVANIIEKEFVIDKDNSIDKRKKDYDKFGYQSLHYIVSLSDSRTSLTEYEMYKELKLEIQIRSVLQHAWAEMEHDIGYKSVEAVPEPVKRSFSRVAALLETADIEFIRLREQLTEYREKLPEDIVYQPENVSIDAESLEAFIEKSEIINQIENEIFQLNNVNRITDVEKYTYTLYSNNLKSLEIYTIKELNETLTLYKNVLNSFCHNYINTFTEETIFNYTPGFSLLALMYIKILEIYGIDALTDFLISYNKQRKEFNEELADLILQVFKESIESIE